MDPEQKNLLDRLVKLSEDNNRILHKMRRSARWGMFWGFVKFLIIAIPVVAGIIYLQPRLANLSNDYSQVKGSLNTINSLSR